MKGLIIRSPWIDMIFEGKKIWEIRGNNTIVRGEVALIKSGTGLIFGTVEITDSYQVSIQELQQTKALHCIPKEILSGINYKNIYAWKLKNPKLFKTPKSYVHPQGAVIWVNLKNMKGGI